MSFSRRTFLIGAGSGLSLLVLTACVPDGTTRPTPAPTPTSDGLVPAPRAMKRSSWSTDTFSRGSHSFLAVGSTPDQRTAMHQPLLDRVFFAGEATSTERPGTVLGARLSAIRAANEVADVAAKHDRIVVIGAGAAGAEVARLLGRRDFDVLVLEARDRVGGRIHTVSSDDWPIPAELGAWRLRATEDSELLTDLAAIGVEVAELTVVPPDPTTVSTVYRSADGETADSSIATAAIATAVAWGQGQLTDVSLADALEGSGAAKTAEGASASAISGEDIPGGELLAGYLGRLAADSGADASDLSTWYGLERPGESESIVTGGFSTLITDALDGIETSLSTAVVGITYSDDGVSLRLGTGESLRADRVVVTAPLGVLQAGGIEFDPLLPFGHRAAIAAIGMGTIDSVWLTFAEPFWSTDAVAWNLVGTESEITTWFNLLPITGEPVLVGLVGGEAALRLAELDDTAFLAAVLSGLEPFARDSAS